ncbi:YbaB/EbfC family DNA-binding protein [Burkholderia gladioli]|uniref:YbaB/EbfC family DNA-binding protein n=1 Tax=Burkholderia gladioli TaxID=28095 RepID=UPI00163E11E3|nr:YbaB/EbfC family DNA-binding protein [Burkholderia gladioli]
MNRFGKAWRALLAAVSLAGAALAPEAASAQLQQGAAPASWIHYAQDAGQRFAISLGREDGETEHLQQALAARPESAAAEPAPIDVLVYAWIGRDGAVTRVEFDMLGTVQVDEALRKVLGAVKLPAPPPDMLQPLRVRLRLEPRPEAPAGGTASPAVSTTSG